MPLPKPDLDDKTFDQLVDEARKLIPRYAPQWTNHNWSDPGITFIDLFAWLTEMTLYRINLETDFHKLKYLQLLGVSPESPTPAKVDLTFEALQKPKEIFKGTEVTTEIDVTGKSITFETDDDITIVPLHLKKVIVDELTGVFDRTDANEKADLFYAPFGLNVRNDCKFYLGFDRDPEVEAVQELNFMCNLYEKDLKKPGKHGEEPDYKFENAQFKWEFSVSSDGNTWKTIQPVKDETEGFKKSGRIFFTNLQDWVKSIIPVWNMKYFWLRCTIEKSKDEVYFEYPPRVDTIKLNTISATHGLTIENEKVKLHSDGLPDQVLELSNTPILNNTLKLESDELLFNWYDISENVADNEKLKQYLKTKFSVPWVQYAKIEKKDENTITISYGKNYITLNKKDDTDLEKWSISLTKDDGMTYEFIGKKDGDKLNIYDGIWKEVKDFDSSGPDDNHYVLDKEQGKVKFGNGLYGRVPPVSSDFKAIKYRAGGGAEGNIKAGYQWKIKGHHDLKIINHRASTGGKDTEDLKEAEGRFLRDLKVPYTAVTSSDFERIVTDTPGLRVAKAKAIANYRFFNGSEIKSKGSVTVAVIPYSPLDVLETPPEPSHGFMDAICQHLDKHRLLGTDVHVVRPVYVRVDVRVTIVPLNGFPEEELEKAVKDKLTQFLHPIKGGKDKDNKGWPIGRMVSRSEIYELIEKINGVDCVIGLTLSGGKGSRMDENGNLELISKITTIYPGSFTVLIIAEADRCMKDEYGRN